MSNSFTRLSVVAFVAFTSASAAQQPKRVLTTADYDRATDARAEPHPASSSAAAPGDLAARWPLLVSQRDADRHAEHRRRIRSENARGGATPPAGGQPAAEVEEAEVQRARRTRWRGDQQDLRTERHRNARCDTGTPLHRVAGTGRGVFICDWNLWVRDLATARTVN